MPQRATRLNATATNRMRRREYFLRAAITIERRACQFFLSMFFLLDLPRQVVVSQQSRARARDRVVRENECQEAAFPHSEIRKSYNSYKWLARSLISLSLSFSFTTMLHVERSLLAIWRLRKQVETFPGTENSPLRYGLNSVVHAARVYIILSASHIYLTRERIIDLRPFVMNLRERLYLVGTCRASKSRHL